MAGKKKHGHNRAKQGRPNRANAPVPVRGFDTAIERAQRALEQNRAQDALNLAETGLTFINPARNPKAATVINQLMAEAHFRLGVEAVDPQEQARRLDAALKLDPTDARFHFHRAVVHVRQDRWAEATIALDKAGDHPGVAFVRSLNHLASGKSWTETGLTPEEINTLTLLQALHARLGAKALDAPAQRPLLGAVELWQALLAQRDNPSAVPPQRLVALAEQLPSPQAQGILHYYAGISALDRGHKQETGDLWATSLDKGWQSPWLSENAESLARETMVALAQAEKWQEIVDRVDQHPSVINDRILSETVGTAYFTLGYQAAQAGKWQKAAELLRKASKFTSGRTLAQNLALCEEALENWDAAGDAWRDMARRRPRSEKHPDYMTDAQVAALWAHAAECYSRSEYVNEEVVNCLRTAVKYAEDDVDLRTKLADALMADDRKEAAENELNRILEIDGNHIPALLRLGHMAAEDWGGYAARFFKRVLAIDPANKEAQEALADHYVKQAEIMSSTQSHLARLTGRPGTSEVVGYLQKALVDLPAHPEILMALAAEYRHLDKKKEATAALLEAYHVNPNNVETADFIMHELLHLDQTADLEKIMADYRAHPSLLMPFWVNQGRKVLHCNLGNDWAMRFFEEALLLAAKRRGNDSPGLAFLQITEAAIDEEADDLVAALLARVRAELPKSGILEYIEARTSFEKTHDPEKSNRLLRRAATLAAKAGDPGVLEQIEAARDIVSGRFNPIKHILRDMGEDLEDLDEDLLDNLLDNFRRSLGGSNFF